MRGLKCRGKKRIKFNNNVLQSATRLAQVQLKCSKQYQGKTKKIASNVIGLLHLCVTRKWIKIK